MSKVVSINSPDHLKQTIKDNKIVVIDFWATWCQPCKATAPLYEKLASQLASPGTLVFVKVDTDKQQAIAQTHKVTAMPTFVVIKSGTEIERVVGADGQKLQAVVGTLISELGDAGPSGTAAGDEWLAVSTPKGYDSIFSEIEMREAEIMNAKSELGDTRTLLSKPAPTGLSSKSAGKSKATSASDKPDWVESDTDEQLMVFIAFQSRVKIFQLQITSLPSATDEDEDDDEAPKRPKTIKLYINSPHILGFDEADNREETQRIEINPDDWSKDGTVVVNTRFVKFQAVSTLTIFISEAEGGGECVRLDRIRVIGEGGEKKDLGKLEKVTDE